MEHQADILKLFELKKPLRVQAPMVRYSKLPFRLLVRHYNVDLCYTPMIVAKDFNRSQLSRDIEFTTNKDDRPLVVQFAASDANEFSLAAQKVFKFCDAVDINCGCPQRWAIQEGIGSALIYKPELISDMVKQTRNKTHDQFPCSVKVRIHDDIKKTIDMVRQIEMSGAKWITVHGRTPQQRSGDAVNFEAIKTIKQVLKIPVIHNGNVFSVDDMKKIVKETGLDGVMSARALLKNPALFSGYNSVPLECIKRFLQISIELGSPFKTVHHHIGFMLGSCMSRSNMVEFSRVSSIAGIIDFFDDRGIVVV